MLDWWPVGRRMLDAASAAAADRAEHVFSLLFGHVTAPVTDMSLTCHYRLGWSSKAILLADRRQRITLRRRLAVNRMAEVAVSEL